MTGSFTVLERILLAVRPDVEIRRLSDAELAHLVRDLEAGGDATDRNPFRLSALLLATDVLTSRFLDLHAPAKPTAPIDGRN